jgi:hypothetical protein
MMFMFTALFWLVVLAVLAKWVFTSNDRMLPEQAERLELQMGKLREELERLSGEVVRLQDEQSFMVRLLSDGDRRLLEQSREERREERRLPPRTRTLDPERVRGEEA